MASESRPDWRKGKSSGGARSKAASGPTWKQRRVNDEVRPAFVNRLRLGSLGLLLMLLVAFFVYWAFRQVKKLPVIAVSVTRFVDPIPPNGFAHEDLERLTSTNTGNISIKDALNGDVSIEAFWKTLDAQLSDTHGGPNDDACVIYLSTHGVTDEQGRPSLLFSNSNPLDSSTWLPVEELLKRMGGLGDSRKVLILDCSRMDFNWSLGQLYNSFNDRLPGVVKESNVKNLYVLTSAGPGQSSWTAPGLGYSAFGYYVAEGLRGRANRKSKDNKITLQELYQYVAQNLQLWSKDRRSTLQQPRLLTANEDQADVALVFIERGLRPTPTDEEIDARDQRRNDIQAQTRGKLDRVRQLWEQYEQLVKTRELVHLDPISLADVQSKLLDAESLALAGAAYEGEFDEVAKQIANFIANAQTGGPAVSLVRSNLPIELRQFHRADDDAARSMWLAAWKAADGTPKPPKEGQPPLPKPGYAVASDVGWQWINGHAAPIRPRIREVLNWIDESAGRSTVPGSATSDLIEIHFLRMLELYLDRTLADGSLDPETVRVVKLALATRDMAERASSPADERLHYWIQPLVEIADVERRAAEDRLFIGDPASLKQAASMLEKLSSAAMDMGGFAAANSRAETVASFYALRDRTFLEMPYLAAWALRRAGRIEDQRNELIHRVGSSIRQIHDFSQLLDEAVAERKVQPDERLLAKYKEASENVGALRTGVLDDARYQKEEGGADSERIRDIGHLLQIPSPLLSAADRQSLTDRYLRILFTADEFDHAAEDQPITDDQASEVNRLRWLADLAPHPVLGILDRSSRLLPADRQAKTDSDRSEADNALKLARQGGEVRRLLSTVLETSNELERITNKLLEDSTETPGNTRAGLSEADRLTRAAAPLVGVRIWSDPAADPAHRLLLVDDYYFCLWQCKRVLDDCWGPATGQNVSYFARVAEQWLAAASKLSDKPRTLSFYQNDLKEPHDLTALLAARQTAIKGVSVHTENVKVTGEEEQKLHEMQIAGLSDLPQGQAAAFIQTAASDGAVVPVKDATKQAWRRRAIQVHDVDKQVLSHFLPASTLQMKGASPDMAASLLFRGHLYSQPFQMRKPKEIVLGAVERSIIDEAKVTVTGDGKRRGFIMFIFDCSGSTQTDGRIGRQKEALQTALKSLLDTGNYYVGLRAYAHRFQWRDTGEKNLKAFSIDSAQPAGDPDTDQELLADVALLNGKHHDDILADLGRLRPWGVTPLYYALKTSLEEDSFFPAKPEEPRHIIVITDGVNEQSYTITTPSQVLEARRANTANRDVRIDIVLVDRTSLDKDPKLVDRLKSRGTTVNAEVKNLEKLALDTGGSYYAAENPAELVAALRKALKLADFSVNKADAPPTDDRLSLGKTWPVQGLSGKPTDFQVQLHGVQRPPRSKLILEGGEWARLEYARQDDRLIFSRYIPIEIDQEDDVRDKRLVVDPVTNYEYEVQALLPKKSVRKVEFFVSVQRTEENEFTTRPRQVWAEIVPLTESGEAAGVSRHFFDADFVLDRPVPVFRFIAHDWPPQATQAAIKFWCKMLPMEANLVHSQTVDPDREITFQAKDLSNVQFTVRVEPLGANGQGRRIIVTEEHPSEDNLFSARVEANPPPDRLEHRYYVGVDTVRHLFDYQRALTPTVQVTPSAAVTKSAIHAPILRVKVKE